MLPQQQQQHQQKPTGTIPLHTAKPGRFLLVVWFGLAKHNTKYEATGDWVNPRCIHSQTSDILIEFCAEAPTPPLPLPLPPPSPIFIRMAHVWLRVRRVVVVTMSLIIIKYDTHPQTTRQQTDYVQHGEWFLIAMRPKAYG